MLGIEAVGALALTGELVRAIAVMRGVWGRWGNGDVLAIGAPLFRLFEAPERRISVTVPGVVGSHVIVVGSPAVKENVVGMLNGFGWLCALATAAARPARTMAKKRMAS